MAASFGKMPTTSVRRLISPLTRSSGIVECSFARCRRGKVMWASTSGSASSISAATFGRSWSATRRHCCLALIASSWAKAVATKAGTTPPAAIAGMRVHVQ
jgi:hypothetical protein